MFTNLKIAAGRRPMTANETRISVVIGVAFSALMLATVFEEYSPKNLSILFMLLFWVPMLVLHEAGHAVVARLLGWRVREMVIGFGRDLWQWQIGETRIKIKLAPIEGYVLPAPREPENIRLKSALIYAAGPGAELLLLAIMLIVFGWHTVFGESDETFRIALKSLAAVILFGAGFNLLPFRTEGAVSDGLGIISSPFMSKDAIEWRLLTFELREIQRLLDTGETTNAVDLLTEQLAKYPGNIGLQLLFATALSADGQDDRARSYVSEKLGPQLADEARRAWLHLQAQVELNAADPSYLTLDTALQNALKITPKAPDLMATKGASLVRRRQYELGGNMLADAWRDSEGGGDDAMMLAYLTIAADRVGNQPAAEHFMGAFEQINRSKSLRLRVSDVTGR